MADISGNTTYNTEPSNKGFLALPKIAQSVNAYRPNITKSEIRTEPSVDLALPVSTEKAASTYTPVAEYQSGAQTQPISEGYSSFIGENPSVFSKAPTETTVARNWPSYLGGGQYALDTANPTALIKSSRQDSSATKALLRQGLSSQLYDVDHIVPLWAGGLDTLENKQVILKTDNQRKQKADSIALTLLNEGLIPDVRQAYIKAQQYEKMDPKLLDQIPAYNTSGMQSPEDAKYWSQKLDGIIANPEPVTFGSVVKEMPNELAKLTGQSGAINNFLTKTLGLSSESTEGVRRFLKG